MEYILVQLPEELPVPTDASDAERIRFTLTLKVAMVTKKRGGTLRLVVVKSALRNSLGMNTPAKNDTLVLVDEAGREYGYGGVEILQNEPDRKKGHCEIYWAGPKARLPFAFLLPYAEASRVRDYVAGICRAAWWAQLPEDERMDAVGMGHAIAKVALGD